MKLEQEYINKFKSLKYETCFRQHSESDCLLCKLLEQLGYEKVVEEYRKIPKYYPSLGETERPFPSFYK